MQHTISVLVENKPGVLTRVASLFARRGFNIDIPDFHDAKLDSGAEDPPLVLRM